MHRRAVRPRHQVLRRGQLQRLQEGRRRGRRRDDQRPGAGRRRRLPGLDRARPAALHPERDPAHGRRAGPALRPVAQHARPTSTAAPASSASCCPCASRPIPQILLPRLPELVDALKSAVRTDIPLDQLDELLGLASEVDTAQHPLATCSAPPYSHDTCNDPRGCVVIPNIDRIRDAVQTRSRVDRPTRRSASSSPAEGAGVWVLNGTAPRTAARRSRATSSSTAWPPRRRARSPRAACRPTPSITVYNGAEAELPETIAYLEKLFGVTVKTATDPTVRTDVVIVDRADTPDLEPPPLVLSRRRRAPGVARAPGYSIGVSQCWYSGSRPRTASK